MKTNGATLALVRQPAGAIHVEIAHPAVVASTGLRHKKQQCVHRLIVPMGSKQFQRVASTVDPEVIAVDGQERIAVDQRQRALEASASLKQQAAFVRDRDLQTVGMSAQVRLQRVCQVVDVDHDPLHPRRAEPVQDMIKQRLAGDLDQRLGPGRSQRPHPLAEACRHDHRGARDRRLDFRTQPQRPPDGCRAHAASAQGSERQEWGTLQANQSRTGSIAGCERSRSRRPHIRGWKRR